jgi:hypothetical protein
MSFNNLFLDYLELEINKYIEEIKGVFFSVENELDMNM